MKCPLCENELYISDDCIVGIRYDCKIKCNEYEIHPHYTSMYENKIMYFEQYELCDNIIVFNFNTFLMYCNIFKKGNLILDLDNSVLEPVLFKNLSEQAILNKIKILQLFS